MENAAQSKFNWTPFYMEFADKLLAYKARRQELLELLEEAHVRAGLRFPFVFHGAPVNDICPFTVLGTFNKGITDSNRISLAKEIGSRLGVAGVCK